MDEQDFSFSYDETTFAQGEFRGGVDLAKLEGDYAELFAEVIWDGVITAEKRARLDRAAELFGLDRARLRQLEQGLMAAYEAQHRVRVQEEVPFGRRETSSVVPFDEVTDPRFAALHGRISFLAARNAELEAQVAALQRELFDARAHLTVDVDVSALAAAAQAADDPTELHRSIAEAPRDIVQLRRLYRALKRAGDADRRYCTSQVLVYLGAADRDERATFESSDAGALIRPTRPLTEDEWQKLVFHPDEDPVPGAIFAAVAPAALLSHIGTAHRRRGPPSRPHATPVDPHATTVQAARCFGWAAAILGMRPPPLEIDSMFAGLVEMMLKSPLSSRLGRYALAGRSARELAFAAGRHLSGYREEHFVLTLARSTRDLEDLFLAALWIGNPGLPMTEDVKRRVEPIVRAIEPLLDRGAFDRLRAAFLRFVERGGRTRLGRWAAAVDRTASRVGLLLSADLGAAHAILALEDPGRVDERMDDLLIYATSEAYTRLRGRIGIDVRG